MTDAIRVLRAAALLAAAGLAAGHAGAGTDPDTLFREPADLSARVGGRAVVVHHGGRRVFEQYDRGWTAERPHPLASGSKSFTGVLAMLAVQDGLLDLDEQAADTLVEWAEDPLRSRITVRHLLSLTSGLDPAERDLGGRGGGNLLGWAAQTRSRRLGLSEGGPRPENLFRDALAVPARHEPGVVFAYGPSHFYAFGELLQRKLTDSGGPHPTVMAYLRERLLAPIGIDRPWIGQDRAGHPSLPGGILLTARDWARFGQFVLDEGRVRDGAGGFAPLLDPGLLAECFRPGSVEPAYGLTWWLPAGAAGEPETQGRGAATLRRRLLQRMIEPVPGPDGRPLDIYLAAGLGRQRLYVLPAFDLVIVRFAEGTREGHAFRDAAFLAPILRAVASDPGDIP